MPNPGPIEQNRDLLADLKQDAANTAKSDAPDASKQHIAGETFSPHGDPFCCSSANRHTGAAGKLATAISQHQGDADTSRGAANLQRQVAPSGGEVDKQAIADSLDARAKAKMPDNPEDPNQLQRGSEAARLQSAAEQYRLAGEAKQAKEQQNRA